MIEERYLIPKKINSEDAPKESSPEYVKEIKAKLFSKFPKLGGKYIENFSSEPLKKISLRKKGKNEIHPISNSFSEVPNRKYEVAKFSYENSFKNMYYKEFSNEIKSMGCIQPDIDQIDNTVLGSIIPGFNFNLIGTCFGSNRGKIFFEIKQGESVELEISSWSDTVIWCALSSSLEGVRPYLGRIWIQTSNGKTSNQWFLQFVPIYTEYVAVTTDPIICGPNLFGASCDDTFLKNNDEYEWIGDPDTFVLKVEKSHTGDGWSELRAPLAFGKNLAQGYHIGVGSCENAWVDLYYHIIGPKGVDHPQTVSISYIANLGDWIPSDLPHF